MVKLLFNISILFVLVACIETEPIKTEPSTLTPHPFYLVELQDEFWAPRMKTQMETLIPFAFEKTTPAVENLAKAAAYRKGDTTDLPFAHRYISSDLYKVMEGAAYLLKVVPNPQLEAKMDSIIRIIGEAQQDDGYLYVAHITGVSKDHAAWGGGGMGDKPYSWVVHSHELYNMGHMYEAAIAYYQATGKEEWLKIAQKNARHINRVFFEGDPNYNDGKPVMQAPGHQEIELALTKMYRVTGDSLYLNMARKFLEIRGVTYVPEGEQWLSPTYAQQHLPAKDQTEAVGHAVRAGYMYSSMAEIDAIYKQEEYSMALDSIWHDIVDHKMHITGGLGAARGIEGFGPDYELPNADTYNETCAAVANVFFNYRMFLKYKEARYLDVAEVSLYNNALAGTNIEGNKFFYVNPLEADGTTPFNHGQAGRSPWFNTACCPSNIARLIPQVSGMMYAHTNDELYLTFYGSNKTSIPMAGTQINIEQETGYPFDGNITIKLDMDEPSEFSLYLRVPTWTRDRFVPGELYKYVNQAEQIITISVNGENMDFTLQNGFAKVSRNWQAGDKVTLQLPMKTHINVADPRIEADLGKVSVSRGPLVYCAEGTDNPSNDISIDMNAELRELTSEIIPGHPVKSIQSGRVTFIPYYSWNNRGDTWMKVWIDARD